MAECCKIGADAFGEEEWRLKCADMHASYLEGGLKEGINAAEGAAQSLLNNSKSALAAELFGRVISWREEYLGPNHPSTLEAVEYLGICQAHQGHDEMARTALERAAVSFSVAGDRAEFNLCTISWNQHRWHALEQQCRRALTRYPQSEIAPEFRQMLATALDKLGKADEMLTVKLEQLGHGISHVQDGSRLLPKTPPGPTEIPPRFGRIIHPRTWSS